MTTPVAAKHLGAKHIAAKHIAAKPRRGRVRTTPILQMEATECGAAALAVVLTYHGRHVPLEELRATCGVSRDGSRASTLVKAARRYGLHAAGRQMETADLAGVAAPAILFWDFHHFVVWEGFGRRFGRPVAFVNDPARGRCTIPMEDFDASFTGVVLTFRPGPDFEPGGRPARLLSDLRTRMSGATSALLMALLASLLLVAVGFVTPAITVGVIDALLLGGATSVVLPLSVTMAVAVLAALRLTVLHQGALLRLYITFSTLSHARFLRHLLRLPAGFFSQRSPADITQRLTSNDDVAQVMVKSAVDVLVNTAIAVVSAALLWSCDGLLALVALAVGMLNVVALRMVTRTRESAVARLRASRAKLVEISFEGVHQIETMKAVGGEDAHFRRWASHQATLLNTEQRFAVPGAIFGTVAPTLAMLTSALVLLIGGLRAVDGALSIGLLVAFQTLVTNFNRPVVELAGAAERIQEFRADVARLKDVESFPADPMFARPEPEHVRRLTGRLDFDQVTFGYSPLAAPLLSGFSFSVGPGQRVALVGGSGSGKSTVVKLISGLYVPWSGEVRLDGQPMTEIARSTLAASVAFVDQDIFLFEGTIRDNVTLWDPSISDDAVWAALEDAAIAEVVARRPGGIYARVEENGRNFSAGQRQRLEIARALVREPSVLVLDEATSALDAETELLIEDNLRRRGSACVVIAHRLSAVRDSDEIIVLAHGQVVERGRHDELVAAGRNYARLVKDW